MVVRGARQVGKTWLVRELAKRRDRTLLELNFERDPQDASLFSDRRADVAVRQLEARFAQRIDPGSALLFLDEVQAAPQVFANLWWFAEDMPELPVIAAGSLLDFVLAEHSFSMPVGRISYLHLDAMTYDEFLAAVGDEQLRRYAQSFTWGDSLADALHARLLSRYQEYLLVGGMPAAVENWMQHRSPVACAEVHHRLITTLRDDFHKYRRRVPTERLVQVFDSVPRSLGRKFVYSRVNREERAAAIRQALDMLCKARVCTLVQGSHGRGIPLGSEIRERVFKVIFMDAGLACAALGLSLAGVQSLDEIAVVNNGALLEQAIGQTLRASFPRFMDPELFYWSREAAGTEAEVDYLAQCGAQVVPIEVKCGKTGTLKSLHMFMATRGLPLAIRFNADKPSITPVKLRTTTGMPAEYTLLSIPLYLAGHFRRLVEAARQSVGHR